tara:strand:+ start:285 stop:434 length:150 start_codon:yes stop_codon:yes gene_type:complete
MFNFNIKYLGIYNISAEEINTLLKDCNACDLHHSFKTSSEFKEWINYTL